METYTAGDLHHLEDLLSCPCVDGERDNSNGGVLYMVNNLPSGETVLAPLNQEGLTETEAKLVMRLMALIPRGYGVILYYGWDEGRGGAGSAERR